MSNCLKIGDRLLDGDQIISALVQYKLLETLVGQVLLDEAIKNIALSKQELFQILIGTTDAPIPEDFDSFVRQWCQHQGVALDYFKAVMLRDFRVQKFKQLRFANQLESKFLHLKADLDQVEYSVIQVLDLSLAQELYFQLRDDGADFAQLAQTHSLGRQRQDGSWVGPVPLSTLPTEIAALFRSEQIGTVYGPVPVVDDFWVVRLERFTATRLTAATRVSLIDRLYNEWLQAQIAATIGTPGMIGVQSNAMQPSPIAAAA